MNTFIKLKALEDEAESFGFRWETALQIIEQIRNECVEITECLTKESSATANDLQAEIGDLLHAAFSLCLHSGFDPEATLAMSLEKFEHRFFLVKELAAKRGFSDLGGQNFEILMKLWQEAKKMITNKNESDSNTKGSNP